MPDCAPFMYFVVVEGAGGLMVPLAGGLLIADLVRELDMPVIVVARASLGTVNHTLLTCFTAKQLDINVAGVIINNYPENPDDAELTAPHNIGSLSGAPLLGVWPHSASSDRQEIIRKLAAYLQTQNETEILLREIGAFS